MQTMVSKKSERKVVYGRIFFTVMAVVVLLETLVSRPLFGSAFWGGMFATLMMVSVALQAEMLFMSFNNTCEQYKAFKYRKAADGVTIAAFICLAISGIMSLWL